MSAAAYQDAHGVSYWTPVEDSFPDDSRPVLATDGETCFVAQCYQPPQAVWFDAASDEEIDTHITHWMELPQLPEV